MYSLQNSYSLGGKCSTNIFSSRISVPAWPDRFGSLVRHTETKKKINSTMSHSDSKLSSCHSIEDSADWQKNSFFIKHLSLGSFIKVDHFWNNAWEMLHLLKSFPWIILSVLFWGIVDEFKAHSEWFVHFSVPFYSTVWVSFNLRTILETMDMLEAVHLTTQIKISSHTN